MRLGGPLRRLAAFAGHAALLAGLGLVAAVLVTAAPRLSNDYADRSLRADIATLPHLARDVSILANPNPEDPFAPTDGVGRLEQFRVGLPEPLPGLVDEAWHSGAVGPEDVVASGDFPPMNGGARKLLGLRAQTGLEEAARLTAGRFPRPAQDAIEIAVSSPVAEALSLRIGARLVITGPLGGEPVDAVVTGVFEPLDASDPVWDDMPYALEPLLPLLDSDPYIAVAIADWTGVAAAADTAGPPTYTWRYRIDERRLDTSLIEPVTAAVGRAERTEWVSGSRVQTSLDTALVRFSETLRSARALLAVVQAGLVASLLGLIPLAARLGVERRREELAVLRARGAAVATIGRRTLAESVVLQPAAVLLGWMIGTLVPGRRGGSDWLVLVVALVTTTVVPVLAMGSQRRLAFVRHRMDLVRQRPSPRRLTVEFAVVLVAAMGVALLRRRGLSQGTEVDPYLSAVPVLLATAAALVALRILPWPLRLLDRLAARARGALLFLGLARAGRGAPVTVGPLAVLVIAVSTGVFSGVVTTAVDDARDRSSDVSIPADAWLTGYAFAPTTGDRLAQVPGVEAVAPVWLESNRRVLSGTGPTARVLGQARIMVVDMPSFARVVEASRVRADLPAALLAARKGQGSVPAVVSPELAETIGRGAVADVQNRLYDFSVAAVSPTFPGMDLGTQRFVVLPWQAIPEYEHAPVIPNRYLLAGDDFDPAAVRRIADDGQRERLASVLGRTVDRVQVPAAVQTWQAHRHGLERTGANEVLTLTFAVGTIGGTILAVLAVGFAVLADARTRGRVRSRLRTMGLSGGQGRRLLVYELVPLVVVAAGLGGVVGGALPRLLGPTLGLSTFTSGVGAEIHLDPLVVGGVLALAGFGLVVALMVESVANRRMRLGEVLRLGEEN